MRVIAGTAKRRKLESVPGTGTRPITDRAKEALFSILGAGIVDARMLDLFGGTGAVGIEALSRGRDQVTFVERSNVALKTLGRNLQKTDLAANAKVVRGDAFKYLSRSHSTPFDYIFIAPRQYEGLWLKALQSVDNHPTMLSGVGEVIIQIHPKEYVELALTNLQRIDTRTYGSVQLDFYAHSDAPNAEQPS